MYNGIINVYKEKGYTSHDVVAKLRGILKQKKIGHTGTLDPQAEGVLPVCLGSGTRLCDMLTDKDKEYEAVLLLGVVTDTQDTTGTVLRESCVTAAEADIIQAIQSFVGEYDQIPPMYSALKVNGKKLYELAREGKEIERKARRVQILSITILSIELPRVRIRVSCSKGTYIRTLCHDIGEKLECGGCMEELLRTKVGAFTQTDALTLKEIERLRDENRLSGFLVGIEEALSQYSPCHMKAEADKLVRNGNPFQKSDVMEQEGVSFNMPVRVYDSVGRFIGVYEYRKEKQAFYPWKMFPESE